MNEMKVGHVLSGAADALRTGKTKPQNPLSEFKKTLDLSIEELNTQLLRADESAQELVMGKGDVHQAMVAMEEANLTLRLMIDIRNKVIAAYEEVMRMQV